MSYPYNRVLIHVSQLHSYIRNKLAQRDDVRKAMGWAFIIDSDITKFPQSLIHNSEFIAFDGEDKCIKNRQQLDRLKIVQGGKIPSLELDYIKKVYERESVNVIHHEEYIGSRDITNSFRENCCGIWSNAHRQTLGNYGYVSLPQAITGIVVSYGNTSSLVTVGATFKTESDDICRIISCDANIAGEQYNVVALIRNPKDIAGGDFIEWYKSDDIKGGVAYCDTDSSRNIILNTHGVQFPH